MSDATLISKKEVGTSGMKQFSFDVPTVATNTVSGRYDFQFDSPEFLILSLKVDCLSRDFDLRLFDMAGVTSPTVNKILERNGNNMLYSGNGLDLVVCNNDEIQVNYLYGSFDNNDLVNNTGTISCVFLVR